MALTHERLQRAREIMFPHESPTDVARKFNWTVSTYLGHENGSRGISKKAAPRYASAFKINLEWLLFGTGEMRAGKTVPLVGYVGAGGLIVPMDDHPKGHGIDRAPAPPELGPDTEALQIRGDSQWPAFADGDYIYCDGRAASPEEAVGLMCVVMTESGERMLKMVQKGGGKGLYQLVSVNAPPILDVRLEWVAPVTWVKKRKR